ncbi:hypothetical protein A2U01_0096610, partial [Trifolium medium]|nr:hypothetical protein [Trifolium medium]
RNARLRTKELQGGIRKHIWQVLVGDNE